MQKIFSKGYVRCIFLRITYPEVLLSNFVIDVVMLCFINDKLYVDLK